MSEQQFDVFLCHNSEDKAAVEQIALKLQKNGIKPWLDIWNLRPGTLWQDELQVQITTITAAAVFVGQKGLGSWQSEEISAFLEECRIRQCPVIPVILNNAPERLELPIFLRNRHWVDFRRQVPDPLQQLIWGITGRKTKIDLQASIFQDLPATQTKQFQAEKSEFLSSGQLKRVKFQYTELKETRNGLLSFGSKIESHCRLQQAHLFIEELGGGIELEMVVIPEQEKSEPSIPAKTTLGLNPHLSESKILVGKYPITQAQWKAVSCLPKVDRVLPKSPSKFKGKDLPVESISLYEAIEFCKRLSAEFKRNYRLPTESEWEYACRAGTTTKFNFGDIIEPKYANLLDERLGSRPKSTTSVGHFPYPNLFGLYDMHGNVYEWCLQQNVDWQTIYGADVTSSEIDRQGLVGIIRGGSWRDLSTGCESSHRKRREPDEKSDFIGLRVVCSA
jgi:formylglycine-generating enzyme required for sulfatase activity